MAKRTGMPGLRLAEAPGPATGQLRRVLGFWDLVLLVIGTVIGSGIFLVPGAVLRPVGNSVPLALAAWLTGGVLSLLGALTYGELSAMKPQAGGLYIYIRDCFGPFPAFLFGWTLFFVLSAGSVATLAVAFSAYFSEFVRLTPWMVKWLSALMIAVIAVVNVRGTRGSADLQNAMTAIKIFAIVLMASALLWRGKSFATGNAAPPGFGPGAYASGFGMAMISVLWAYEGWQYATFSAGEAINPQRNFPLAFLVGSATLIAIYLFANFGYLAALGPAGVSRSNRVAASAVSLVISPVAAKLVALTILVSIFSAANSIMLTAPRVYYAMARDGVFFNRLSEIHPRYGPPAFAVIALASWAAISDLRNLYWLDFLCARCCQSFRLPEARSRSKAPVSSAWLSRDTLSVHPGCSCAGSKHDRCSARPRRPGDRHRPPGGSSLFDLAAPYAICLMKKSGMHETVRPCLLETYED
jgi:APA family basic amino acid/polyamine antiporter